VIFNNLPGSIDNLGIVHSTAKYSLAMVDCCKTSFKQQNKKRNRKIFFLQRLFDIDVIIVIFD